jgi:hypothetical protein
MKKIVRFFFIKIILSQAFFVNAQYTTSNSVAEELNRLILARDCGGAEAYARTYFQPPVLHTLFGMISIDCKGNKQAAVEYFKMAARNNDSVAIEMLVRLGEASPDNRITPPPYLNSYGNQSTPVMPPPKHSFSPMPQPRQLPQQVIIVSPQVIQPFNAAACIQDGGGTYCGNYRR